MANISIGFHPNTTKTSSKSGKTPIYMRVLMNGQKIEVRLDKDFDLTPNDVLKWNEHSQRLDAKDSDVNEYLNQIYDRGKKLKIEMYSKGAVYSPKEFVDKVLLRNEVKREHLLIEYVRRYLREEIENGSRKEGTKRNYRNAVSQYISYLQMNNLQKITVPEFDFKLANGFKKYLESNIPTMPEKKINQTVSSSTKIKNIKPIFTRAIDEDIISKNPFTKIKLCYDTAKTKYLLINEINTINNLKLPDSRLEFTKDFFLFMCFTGLSYCDAINLNEKDIRKLASGRLWLVSKRTKSDVPINQVICNEAQSIMNKYWGMGNNKTRGNIFPYETGESINIKLKSIGLLAGIQFSLFTKIARVSCRELLAASKTIDQLLKDSFMGWSRVGKIQDRYENITEEKLLEFTGYLDTYLEKNFKNDTK